MPARSEIASSIFNKHGHTVELHCMQPLLQGEFPVGSLLLKMLGV